MLKITSEDHQFAYEDYQLASKPQNIIRRANRERKKAIGTEWVNSFFSSTRVEHKASPAKEKILKGNQRTYYLAEVKKPRDFISIVRGATASQRHFWKRGSNSLPYICEQLDPGKRKGKERTMIYAASINILITSFDILLFINIYNNHHYVEVNQRTSLSAPPGHLPGQLSRIPSHP